MERIIQLVLETSLLMSGSVLVLLLFSKLFASKTRPALRHLCWIIVAVGLLVPFRPAVLTFTLPQGSALQQIEAVPYNGAFDFEWTPAPSIIMPYMAERPAYPAYPIHAPTVESMETINIVDALTMETAEAMPIAYYLEAEAAKHTASPTMLTKMHEIIWQLLFVIWAVGAVGFVLFYAIQHLHFIRKSKRGSYEITSGPLYNMFILMRCAVGIQRKVRLMVNTDITVPIMYGFFRPVILLPEYLLNADNVQQRLIILHEMLHIKRGDILTRLLYFTAAVVHWFNPLVRLMNRVALDESEKACDDAVLRHSDDETRAQYTNILLNAAWQNTRARGALAHALTGGGRSLKNRLKNIITQTTPKRWVLAICTVLMVAGVVVFSLVNFGRENDNDDSSGTYEPGPDTEHAYFAGEPIRISVASPTILDFIFRQAFASFREQMAMDGITVYMDFQEISLVDAQGASDLLLSRFAAGQGPDIFLAAELPSLIPFIDNNFLADIYSLIDRSSSFQREDFFVNVLESIEIDGKLFYMPLMFFNEFIGINSNVPQVFLNRFVAFDYVSVSDIILLHRELIQEHPEFAEYALIHGMDSARALEPEISRMLNIHDRSVSLSELQPLYNAVRTAFAENNQFNTPSINLFPSYEDMQMLHDRYVFRAGLRTRGLEALFEFNEDFFLHYLPRVTDNRQLIAFPSNTIAIGQNAEPIVLYFIEHIIQELTASAMAIDILCVPIMRQFYPAAVEEGLLRNFMSIDRETTRGIDQINDVIEQKNRLVVMPMVMPVVNTLFSRENYISEVHGIMADDIAAFEAIGLLQQRFAAWLNVEMEIVPYVAAPVVDADDPNVRTLTVFTSDRHEAILRHTADELNRTWAQEGRDYRFYLVIDSYDQWEVAPNAHARLQVELMAGGGPDLFIWNGQPTHAWARAGMLTNFYDLIDACPQTDRDDFFHQALTAFETHGGLYMFPLSFGFQYVAINTRLPQSAINRFAQYSTISVSRLFELYQEIKAAYGDEVAHLTLVEPFPNDFLRTALFNGFIDFENRTSQLMDERFVTLLDNWASREDAWPEDIITWSVGLFGLDIMGHEFSRQNMFMIDSTGLNPGNAFFNLLHTHFTHHIPLTDENGHLLVNQRGQQHGFWANTWAVVCVPSATRDSALAWEFILQLIHSCSQPPFGRGNPDHSWYGEWTLTTPILRSLFESHIGRALERYAEPFDYFTGPRTLWRTATQDPDEIALQINNAINRIAGYNEMPIGMMDNMFPPGLIDTPMRLLADGVISAQDAAQRMHNAITLWLIE